MRLIDADTLVKDLSYLYTKNHILVDMRAKEILTTIMEQPTSYSIDKVVEDVRCRCYEMGLDESQTEIVVSEIVKQCGVRKEVY